MIPLSFFLDDFELHSIHKNQLCHVMGSALTRTNMLRYRPLHINTGGIEIRRTFAMFGGWYRV